MIITVFAVLIFGGQGRKGGPGGQGGPPPVYRTEVPESALNVIAGAPTKDSVVLSVLSRNGGKYMASYHPVGGEPKSVNFELEPQTPKEIALADLKASSEYEYVIQGGNDYRPLAGTFRTAKSAGKAFQFDIQADSHLDGNTDTAVYERTLNNIIQDKPDFLVDLGDTFMVDKYPNYQDSSKQYHAQRYWFSKPGKNLSVFLCLGNHDGETGWKSRGGVSSTEWAQSQREKYFPVVRPNSFYSGAPRKGLYYSWNWGDGLFMVLDPFVATTQKTRNEEDGWNWTLGSEQFKWMESTLKQSKAKFKFLFIHHLVGGFGKEARGGVEAIDRFEWGDTKEFPIRRVGWAEPIHKVMQKYGVTAMFHGHDHLYVHQERDGITYLEVPQPSHGRGDNTSSAEEYGYKTGKLLGSSGHIRVSVESDNVKVEYVKSRPDSGNREVVDSFEMKPRS